MKKFLSLVLALVMTMSLVTISAGAKDFTDDDKVNYAEAIDVLSEVKVIDGYTDGSFKPQTQLNRGQAAKILCNMILGPTTASALKADSAPFKDVAADSTFAGYIAYCAQAGIIDGYTDGTFRPAAPLTGYAFMKLLLGALGYDKDIEGYNVPNWSINVAKQALAIGLDDGLVSDFDGTKIVTREEACLYALNTLKATMVDYDSRTTVSIGGTEIVVGGSKAEPVAQTGYSNKMHLDNLQFAEKYFGNLGRQDVQDAYGRPANKWTLKTSSIGTYVKAGTKVASYEKGVKEGDLYTLIGSSLVSDLNAGRADLKVYMNGAWLTGQSAKDQITPVKFHQGVAMFDKNSGTKVGGTGVKTEVFVDDTKTPVEVTVVGVGTYLFQASEDYNTRKETVKITPAGDTTDFIAAADFATLTLSQDDFDVEDVKADDYLLITAAYNAGTGKFDIKTVTPAETKTGIINTYDVEDNMTVDGEALSYSFATSKGANKVKSESYVVGENACVVLDTYGNIIGIDSNYVAGNYLYLFEGMNLSGLRGGQYKVAAYFTDGTNSDVTVKKIENVTPSATINRVNGGWYTFSKNSQNEYNLMKVETKYGASQAAANIKATFGASVYDFVQNGKVNFLNASANLTSAPATASVKGDSKTVFVVLEADDTVSTYTGIKNIPDICVTSGDATVTYLKDNTGYADYVFVDLTQATATVKGQTNSDFVYVVEYKGQTYIDENNTYYTYKVLDDNGDVTTIKTDSTFMGTGNVFALRHKARTNADGYITQLPVVAADGYKLVSGTLTSAGSDTVTYSNGSLVLGTAEYTVADDAKIVLVTKANELKKDDDAKYEVYNDISARTLGALLNGYKVDATYAGQKTDATSDELNVLYVTVTALTAIP